MGSAVGLYSESHESKSTLLNVIANWHNFFSKSDYFGLLQVEIIPVFSRLDVDCLETIQQRLRNLYTFSFEVTVCNNHVQF
jgi:hypothetical protein